MSIKIELEPAVINKQGISIKDIESINSMKNSKEILLKTTKLTKANAVEINLEAIQGDAKE